MLVGLDVEVHRPEGRAVGPQFVGATTKSVLVAILPQGGAIHLATARHHHDLVAALRRDILAAVHHLGAPAAAHLPVIPATTHQLTTQVQGRMMTTSETPDMMIPSAAGPDATMTLLPGREEGTTNVTPQGTSHYRRGCVNLSFSE